MPFVFAYRRDTGEQVRVPESHLRIFPDALSRTPRREATETKAARAARQADEAATAEAPAEADMKE